MNKTIDGIQFQVANGCACCHILNLSEQLKMIIRQNLSVVCHGSQVSDYLHSPLYSYQTTIKSFLDRYEKKTPDTKKGMIGEFISHILIISLFDDYEVSSAFFNLEEKSIKKGFDLLLYKKQDSSMWITEVKSGNLHKGKNHDQTTKKLLSIAKADLNHRLNTQEEQYWLNAINHVKAAVHDEKDYRKILLNILIDGAASDTIKGCAKSQDKNVFLISNLFAPLSEKISLDPVKEQASQLSSGTTFANSICFSIQKGTYQKVVDFLYEEIVDGGKK